MLKVDLQLHKNSVLRLLQPVYYNDQLSCMSPVIQKIKRLIGTQSMVTEVLF